MNGQQGSIRGWKETMARYVGGNEGARPWKVAPWPTATTAWDASETRDQG